MPFYETVFIARQDISAQQADGLAETFAKIITDNDGKIAKTENWGLRTLAYRIKKNRKGHYIMFSIDAPAAAVAEMERQMRLNEDVLRQLTVKVDELEQGPSVMMQSRDQGDRDRGSRPRRDDRPRRSERSDGPRPAPAPKPEPQESQESQASEGDQ